MGPQSVSASILLQRGAKQQGRHGAAAKVEWGARRRREEAGKEPPAGSGLPGWGARLGQARRCRGRARSFSPSSLPPFKSDSAARSGSSPARPRGRRRRRASLLPFVPSRDAGTPAAAAPPWLRSQPEEKKATLRSERARPERVGGKAEKSPRRGAARAQPCLPTAAASSRPSFPPTREGSGGWASHCHLSRARGNWPR